MSNLRCFDSNLLAIGINILTECKYISVQLDGFQITNS